MGRAPYRPNYAFTLRVSLLSSGTNSNITAAAPKPAVEAMSDATRKAMASADFEKALVTSGFEPEPYLSAETARRYMAEEYDRWKPVVASIGLKTN